MSRDIRNKLKIAKKKILNKRPLILLVVFLINLAYILILYLLFPPVMPKDVLHYLQMAQKERVPLPFRNRILIPFIVSLFPIEFHLLLFNSISLISILLLSITLFLYLQSYQYELETCLFGVIIFMGSSLYQFSIYNLGLIDPPFLLAAVLSLLFVRKEKIGLSILTIILAYLTKEAIIFFIPLLLIGAAFKRNIKLLLALLFSLIVVITIYFYTNIAIGLSFNRFIYFLNYHNIYLEHGLFPAFIEFTVLIIGYVLYLFGVGFFYFLFGFLKISNVERLKFIILCGAVVLTLFLAFDWQRMTFILFPMLVLLGSKPFNELAIKGALKEKTIIVVVIIISTIWLILYPCISYLFYDIFYGTSLKIITYFFISLPLPIIYLIFMKKNTDFSLVYIISHDLIEYSVDDDKA